ncbi:response regulator transcription factor [Egibacter rhizosphaerae]|uniref:Response regulator transcription factor n=1 Tax=Egibacter rhizosphaerae TaxID=1670831 RepID=A0A411YJ33_9ACTN|nr:response regulator transcription factor [Egibacter rhizosphaerae]QBI21315.1 response regulator transcription factor [Egibacter rhizosphaerae]
MIRVCLVDDQTLVRAGLRQLLELTSDVVVSCEAGDGDEALAAVEADPPDVLLLDLRMPVRDGISVLRTMRERGDEIPTLVLTTFDDDELVLGALRAGAHGYLLKDVTLEGLVGAIRTIAAGGTMWQPAITERLVRAAGELPARNALDQEPDPQPLTGRELEILRLLAGGYANREIATALHLAPGTVKNHVSSILLKLGVRDRTQAILRALHTGLLTDRDRAG